MARYVISYDLRKPDHDYRPLYDELDELGATHIQDSVWAVRTELTAKQVFDALWEHLHSGKDRLLVVETSKSNWTNRNGINKFKNV